LPAAIEIRLGEKRRGLAPTLMGSVPFSVLPRQRLQPLPLIRAERMAKPRLALGLMDSEVVKKSIFFNF